MCLMATILSGNSELLIAEAVNSVRDGADQILLIATGITDNTLSIARDLEGQSCTSSNWRGAMTSLTLGTLRWRGRRPAAPRGP